MIVSRQLRRMIERKIKKRHAKAVKRKATRERQWERVNP